MNFLIWALFWLCSCLTAALMITYRRSGPNAEMLTYALTTSVLALLAALYLAGSHLSA